MTNWQSPLELATDEHAYDDTIFAFFGVMFWEIFQTSGIEWQFITRQKTLTWPRGYSRQVPYYLARYCTMLSLIGLVILVTVTEKINCGGLYHFVYWAGNTGIACSSTLLALKAIEIWNRNVIVMITLVLLCIPQWAILYHCIITVDATWDDTAKDCIMDQSNATIFKVSYILVLACDLASLCLAIVGVKKKHPQNSLFEAFSKERLHLWAAPVLVNIFPVAFSLSSLNVVMDVITVTPASVLSAIAACRLTVAVEDEDGEDGMHHTLPTNAGVIGSRVVAKRVAAGSPSRYSFAPSRTRPAEVRVVTDHMTIDNKDESFLDSPTTDNSVRDDDFKINIEIEEVVRTTSEAV
ncbi:hypothetical protein SCHPADRAFT_249665 [Schizopora paradoxa]|uniref:Transmembrane protein n=1 Tax=Schizopora paradoxa TaxID=27342 RepID=A0A0H2RVK3_9AGAM|nr:hypothetical protein SCHPADRAFT_249665 [Schizopora paradoxa]